MNEEAFVQRRDPDWRLLMALCDRAESSPSKLDADELRQFVKLYRKISTDLALARTRSTNLQLIDFLNDLAGRAYGILYRQPRKPILASLFHAVELSAQTVRRRKWFVIASFLLFFGSAFVSFFMMRGMPRIHDVMIPPGQEKLFESWKTGDFKERTSSESTMMTGFYASNNPKVAIIAGAIGAGSFGTLSVFMVMQNGAILGVLASELAPLGKVGFLVQQVSPHGVPELSGIIISGSAGLLLGFSLINPGRRTRGESLKAAGKDAIVLLSTSVVMMFIAAPIEGFFSFNPNIPGWFKLTVAGISLTIWLLFWSRFGMTEQEKLARS